MYNFLPILLFAVSYLYSIENLTKESIDDVFFYQGELKIDNNNNYGLSFNLKYNPSEIKSASPHPVKNIEMFHQKKTDSTITVFLFHQKVKKLPNIFKFNFINIEGFHDTSNIEFFNIEIRDEDGNRSEYPNQYLKIDFSDVNKINRNKNHYENMNEKDIYNDISSKHTMNIKNSLVSRIKLYIDTDVDVRGIQFDIKYNSKEIRSVIPHDIEGFEMRYNNVTDNLMRGLIFSLKGEALPKGLIFDFTNIEGFSGTSLVEFTDFILADEKGNPIEVQPQLFNISFATMPEIKSPQMSLNRQDIYDNSWAVIIGIDKYQYSDPLNYAVKDAEAVKNMLINKFDYPEENIRYLIDEEATLSNIKLNLGEVAISAGENDRILVFYSGHGQTLIGTDKSEKGYIIPYEGKQDNPYATGIAMDEILTTSQISKSKHMLFLMDACYSGLMTEHVKGLQPQEEGYLTKVANEQARQIITAGGNEPAIEGGRWNHSVFTKNLLSGLDDWDADTDSDGYITADELGTYLRKQVTEDSNNQQTPQKGRFMNSGTGEFVFFSDVTVTLPSNNLYEEDEIISGCMDENANNYNPNATNPDRSCQYGKLITSLEFGEFDTFNKTVPIIINNNEPVSYFEFGVSGVEILDLFGGIVDENNIFHNYVNDEEYIEKFEKIDKKNPGYVFGKIKEPEMDIEVGGNQILCYLKIELPEDYNIDNMCLKDIVLANSKGQFIKNIYNHTLTCYGD